MRSRFSTINSSSATGTIIGLPSLQTAGRASANWPAATRRTSDSVLRSSSSTVSTRLFLIYLPCHWSSSANCLPSGSCLPAFKKRFCFAVGPYLVHFDIHAVDCVMTVSSTTRLPTTSCSSTPSFSLRVGVGHVFGFSPLLCKVPNLAGRKTEAGIDFCSHSHEQKKS